MAAVVDESSWHGPEGMMGAFYFFLKSYSVTNERMRARKGGWGELYLLILRCNADVTQSE